MGWHSFITVRLSVCQITGSVCGMLDARRIFPPPCQPTIRPTSAIPWTSPSPYPQTYPQSRSRGRHARHRPRLPCDGLIPNVDWTAEPAGKRDRPAVSMLNGRPGRGRQRLGKGRGWVSCQELCCDGSSGHYTPRLAISARSLSTRRKVPEMPGFPTFVRGDRRRRRRICLVPVLIGGHGLVLVARAGAA